MGIREAWISARATIKRKNLQKSLSLFGATIILATFIVKDARTDMLKELGDSLAVAQNKFDIEIQERKTYNAVILLQRETSDQLGSLHQRFDLLDGYSPRLMPNAHPFPCQMLDNSSSDLREHQGDFQYVSALASRLPETTRKRYDIEAVQTEFAMTHTRVDQVRNRCPDSDSDQPVNPPTLDEVVDVDKSVVAVNTRSHDIYSKVLADATAQHERAEQRSELWRRIYYALYAIGWLLVAAGILLGEERPLPGRP